LGEKGNIISSSYKISYIFDGIHPNMESVWTNINKFFELKFQKITQLEVFVVREDGRTEK
jgi:hypothetical protein